MTAVDETELRSWLDRLAINDLINRYADAVTRADNEQMATVFTHDAVWECPLMGVRFETSQAFLDWQITGSTGLEILIHTPHSPVITLVDAARATATTTIHERFRGVTTNDVMGEIGMDINVDQFGVYYDDVVKAHGEWKFTRRHFAPFLITQGGVVGDAVSPRPMIRPT